MTHILEMFPPSKYIAAFELQGSDRTLTIKSVRAEIIEGENNRKDKRPILYFEEGGKPLVLNKTNAKILIKLYGANYASWPGKRVTLYPTVVDAFGEKVEAVRLRKVVPSGKASAPGATDPQERIAVVIEKLRAAASVKDVESVWKRAAKLREEIDSEALDSLTLIYESRLTDLDGA